MWVRMLDLALSLASLRLLKFIPTLQTCWPGSWPQLTPHLWFVSFVATGCTADLAVCSPVPPQFWFAITLECIIRTTFRHGSQSCTEACRTACRLMRRKEQRTVVQIRWWWAGVSFKHCQWSLMMQWILQQEVCTTVRSRALPAGSLYNC
jgi:hypothetical protein